MQFDDGSGDTPTGHDMVIDGSNGPVDLGVATYDSDHDGVADSIVIGQGDLTYVYTDSDHDGHVDAQHAYDSQGHEVDPSTGAPIAGTTGSTGSTSATGFSGVGAGTSTGDTVTGDDGSSATGGITVTGDDGSAHSLGAPTVDLDKDGQPDTAVIHNPDGSVTGYTDRDGDGNADQITQIDADGKVVIAVSDGHGGWEVAATGHMDSDGKLVEDVAPAAGATLSGVDSNGVTTHGTTPASSDITFTDGGKDFDLGKPTADMNGVGHPDTVVTHLADGTVVGYSDTDGDGTADQVTEVSPDGHVVIGVPDGHGGWTQAATGHMGPDGKFVPDAKTTAGSATV